MGNEVYSAAVAIGLGVLVGTALFVPFVAVSYRRRGRLTLGRSLLWAAALVSFLAIWTYTLLPLPDAGTYACAGVNLDVTGFIGDLRSARSVTDFAVLQLALNVLLFLPLGFFLRALGGRGILVGSWTVPRAPAPSPGDGASSAWSATGSGQCSSVALSASACRSCSSTSCATTPRSSTARLRR